MASVEKNKGFTLVELSIVIVIIGLIVAGVVGGQALVNQAKLRTVISDIEKFDTAVNAFKLEFNAPPGDLRNASNYWPGVPNGNGNGEIVTSPNVGNGHDGEYWFFWHHLGQNASGLLSGAYTITGVNPNMTLEHRNLILPLSKTGYHWGVFNRSVTAGHQYVLGASDSRWAFWGAEPSLSPKNTLSVDNKIDDGMPATGIVIVEGIRTAEHNSLRWRDAPGDAPTYAQTPTSGNCAANGAASYDETAEYNVAFDEVTCVPVIRNRLH